MKKRVFFGHSLLGNRFLDIFKNVQNRKTRQRFKFIFLVFFTYLDIYNIDYLKILQINYINSYGLNYYISLFYNGKI